MFISRKPNTWDKRYGFVRFFDVKNVKRMEKELDSIRIRALKLHVNIPRYRKEEDSGRKAVKLQKYEDPRACTRRETSQTGVCT